MPTVNDHERQEYIVEVRQVFISTRSVEAKDINEAKELGKDQCTEIDLYYSHDMNDEHTTAYCLPDDEETLT